MTIIKKIASVFLFFLGCFSIYGWLLRAAEIVFMGQYLNFSQLIWRNVGGICLLWVGAKLWQRWRLALGIISIICGLPLQLGKLAFWSYRKGYLAFSDQSHSKPELFSIIAVVTISLVIGILLIYWQKCRDRREIRDDHSLIERRQELP